MKNHNPNQRSHANKQFKTNQEDHTDNSDYLSEYKHKLNQFIKFKSISATSDNFEDIVGVVDWLRQEFIRNNFKVDVVNLDNKHNPVLISQYFVNENLETILIYGHYDVQPDDPRSEWNSDPFELTENQGRLYARGSVDNKGQLLIHMYSVFELIKLRKLNYNVKFIIEGNEETGNAEMLSCLKNNKKLLEADYILISDGEISGENPLIEASTRGGMNVKLNFKVANKVVHSGIYGGAVPNASVEMINFLNKLFLNNKINIDGFYDDVDLIDEALHKNTVELSKRQAEIYKNIGLNLDEIEDNELNFYKQTGLMPTVQITGFNSGYIGDGFANIVPNIAEVKLNFRTVASQNIEKIAENFEKFVHQNIRKYVKAQISYQGMHKPEKLNIETEMHKKIVSILEQVYKQKVLYKNVGGALPIISEFKEVLGLEPILVPLGNDDCNMHGPNENFRVDLIKKGIEFSMHLFGSGD